VLDLHLALLMLGLALAVLLVLRLVLSNLVEGSLDSIALLTRHLDVLVQTKVATAMTHLTPTMIDARALTTDIASLGSTTGLSLAIRSGPMEITHIDPVASLVSHIRVVAHLVFLLPAL